MKKVLSILFLVWLFCTTAVNAQVSETKTAPNDKASARMLIGKHRLSLQWISWDYFGSATVSNKKCDSGSSGCYHITGEQKGRGSSDLLKIDGAILSIDTKQFKFRGKIETQISHINGGKPCVRSGDFTFTITGKRKYWRLMEMDNPCEWVTDYVDIYFG